MSQYPQTYSNKNTVSFLDVVWYYKFRLVFYIVAISFLSFVFLYAINAVPDELKTVSQLPDASAAVIPTTTSTATGTSTKATNQGELPVRVVISKIGVDTVVNNPQSSDNNTLNDYLLRGAVRYPGSGTLGNGNVFIFGHSTSLKIVNNQAYKTFVGLQNLNIGDEIQAFSNDKEYDYQVTSVELQTSDKVYVDLSSTQNMITLSTCDVLGQKEQRFVVQAVFVSSHSI